MPIKLTMPSAKTSRRDVVEHAVLAMEAIDGFNKCLMDITELETIHSNLQLVVNTIQSCDDVAAATRLLDVGTSLENLLGVAIDKSSKQEIVAGCEGLIGNVFKAIGNAIKAFFDWIKKLFSADAGEPNKTIEEGEKASKSLDQEAKKTILDQEFPLVLIREKTDSTMKALNNCLTQIDTAAKRIQQFLPLLDDKSEETGDRKVFDEAVLSDENKIDSFNIAPDLIFRESSLREAGWSSVDAYLAVCKELDKIASDVFSAADKKIVIPYEKKLTSKLDALTKDLGFVVKASNAKLAAHAIQRIIKSAGYAMSKAFAIKQRCSATKIVAEVNKNQASD